ncbi:hypothetical protein CLV46_1077 [Diaminobutyricimonas aerilata]|uniref:Uncharacterized protein n=1 Tax=Diaminobutyricimonas aerilata TaxID=1162967 RepID=A0A2M9CI16_9MICO|nr:hypothetical protein [Diaminobutyricimonas aerilata]PJJ71528.1 hypothetical protein CLV46_1077 [Diaminobutyricimonas aerilata]
MHDNSTLRRLLLVAVAALTLAGCATAAPAEPVASPSASSPSPTPTPTEDPDAPAAIVIGPAGFAVHSATDEVLTEVRWDAEPDALLEAVDVAFEADPVTGEEKGDGTHIADFDTYAWEGLTLGIARLDFPRTDYFLPAWIRVDAPTVEELDVVTRTGQHVGSDLTTMPGFAEAVRRDWFEGGVMYLTDPEFPERVGSESKTTKMIGLLGTPDGGPVTAIHSPQESYLGF